MLHEADESEASFSDSLMVMTKAIFGCWLDTEKINVTVYFPDLL